MLKKGSTCFVALSYGVRKGKIIEASEHVYKVKLENGVVWNQHKRNVFEDQEAAIQEYTKRNEEHKDLMRKAIRDKDDMIRVLYRQLNTDIEFQRLLKEVIEEKATELDIKLELEVK